MFIDNIVVQVFSMGVGAIFGVKYVAAVGTDGMITGEQESLFELLAFALGFFVVLAYFVISETIWQKTPAKFITKTMVVDIEGRKPTLRRIVGRSFARLIPFEVISFLSGSNPVGWHDYLSGTRVVDCERFQFSEPIDSV